MKEPNITLGFHDIPFDVYQSLGWPVYYPQTYTLRVSFDTQLRTTGYDDTTMLSVKRLICVWGQCINWDCDLPFEWSVGHESPILRGVWSPTGCWNQFYPSGRSAWAPTSWYSGSESRSVTPDSLYIYQALLHTTHLFSSCLGPCVSDYDHAHIDFKGPPTATLLPALFKLLCSCVPSNYR